MKYNRIEGALDYMKTDKPLSECTGEDFLASRRRKLLFGPERRRRTHDELVARGRRVKVIDDDVDEPMSVSDELKALGYSGYYREDCDGTITRIIPLDEHGNREGI